MTENIETTEQKHSEGMLQVEKDVLIGEELQLVSVEKTKINREGEESEFYIFYAKRASDGVMISFYGSKVINEQWNQGYLKLDTTFTLDKFTSRSTGNAYYKAVILHKEAVK